MPSSSESTSVRKKKALPADAPRLDFIAQRLRGLAVPIDQLAPDPANARLHPERSVDGIAASLKRFGQRKPIVVDAQGVTIAGAGVLMAARKLGWSHLAAVQHDDLSPSERAAYAIADNRLAELSEWDERALETHMTALPNDLREVIGFDDADLEQLIAGGEPGEAEPAESNYREQFGVIVICRDEAHQQQVYDQLVQAGHECKVVTT